LSDRQRAERKADRRMRRYEEERLMLEKRSEELEVFEEVFDRSTLEGIYKLIHKKVIDRIHGVIRAGKEARIYWGKGPEGNELAIKIYYTTTSEFRKGMVKYIEGDPRFKRVRKNVRGRDSMIYLWAQKEFSNLKLSHDAGVKVPAPIEFLRNILVMAFIGTNGVPAPLLRDIELSDPSAFYRSLLKEIKLLYSKAGLVHGDLSEYNIMVWEDAPIIFDVSQAVLIAHPLSGDLLSRDIERVNKYFEGLGVDVPATVEVERWIKGGAEELR